jgi:hypothetical protein
VDSEDFKETKAQVQQEVKRVQKLITCDLAREFKLIEDVIGPKKSSKMCESGWDDNSEMTAEHA